MAIPLTINGATFEYPQNFDENWGIEATGWAQAVTNGMLQMSGGSFPLTADANFGPNFGLLSKYFETRSSNPATTGTVRLSSADAGIAFRNNANSGNLILTTNASDQLLFNGTPVGSGVSSVSGTANQITSTGGTTPVLAIANPLILPGAMTAGGNIAMASNKITGLANGTASGDAVNFSQVGTQTDWASYTPTFTGIGTPTNVSFFWRQIGSTIYVKGYAKTGTCTAADFSLTLPNSTAINYSHLPNPANSTSPLGYGFGMDNGGPTPFTSTRTFAFFADGSSTTLVFLAFAGASSVFSKAIGQAPFNNTDGFSCEFSYPI